MTLIRLSATTALVLALGPASVAAQAACTIDLGKPGQVKDANNALAKAAIFAGKPVQLLGTVKEAITKLQKDDAKVLAANPVGRAMTLGTAYVEAAALDSAMKPVSRASIGLVTDPTGMIDLVAAADSMLDIVEASSPACKADTEGLRRRIYGTLINQAVNTLASNPDSAIVLSDRGLVIYNDRPLAYYAYNVKGNALQAKNMSNEAIAAFVLMTEVMKGDTSLLDERRSFTTNTAGMMVEHAKGLEGDAKAAQLKMAIGYLEGFLTEFPKEAESRGALAGAFAVSGDTAGARKIFAQILGSPDEYTEAQLLKVAVSASQADLVAISGQLFEASLLKNPWSRDGLFNSAVTLQRQEKWNDAESRLRKLVQVDPENPEVYQVFAVNYQGIAKLAKAAAAGKAATSPEVKNYAATNDSLLKYFQRFQDSKVKVSFSIWSHDGNKHTLGGSVQNLGDAEKTYPLTFEFMDASGKVVASKAAEGTTVPGKGAKAFKIEVEGAGVVAFKYAPFPPT